MPIHPENLKFPSVAKTSASTNTAPPWNPINELTEKHKFVLQLKVQGVPYSKIKYALKRRGTNFSKAHMQRIWESEKGQEYASLYSAQFHGGMTGLVAQAQSIAPEALYHTVDIMRDPLAGSRHRLAAAADLMDRVGPPKISRQETENRQPTMIVINLTQSQLSQFIQPPAMIEAEVVPLLEQPSSNDE